MSNSDHFVRLKNLTDLLGPIYGTEDWSLFMYALVKIHKPLNVVELGTGLGATALWIATALQENGLGKLYTVDDGRHWPDIVKNTPEVLNEQQRGMDFASYINAAIQTFNLAEQMELIVRSMPPFPVMDQPIDLLFSDFMHGPDDLLRILGHFLPQMSASCSIFMDSASTSFASFAMLEMLTAQLNAGKIPQMLLNQTLPEHHASLAQRVQSSQFLLIHMVEKKQRAQNSTAWLKIQPVDLRPYPVAPFH